ncbi:MAG TPA: TetR/AcrR family transcriptional regulator [Paenibacillus sp.]|uniref:TetR family transcriptional regulator n=1 Tax=Paenibacillus TaxID=44249 RepID=UPI000B9FEF27|nr:MULTISPECIES: TetR family transcriptional regulator [Paenibacillus]OZQ74127.1 TetR family transcriptional regulator [Paenibacillus taichungensis]HBU82751.1 TetR/AcrR family transcriptional regulator [Paenibacillus sp.]
MSVNPQDPRVKRTRQLFVQAFNDLIGKKRNVYSISVHDITNQAIVNRTTFYAHFQDKYDFLEYWMTEKFQMTIRERLPEEARCNEGNLRILMQTIFDFLLQFKQCSTPGDKQFEAMFENAMHQDLHRLLLKRINEVQTKDFSQEKWEAMALVISWGIFGSALQWSRNPQDRSFETMFEEVIEVLSFNLAPYWKSTTR